MSTPHERTIAALRRRLERMELEHLREHATKLIASIDDLERQLAHAQDAAEFWHNQAMTLMAGVDDPEHATHRCVGLAKTGELMVVRLDA